MQFIQNVITLTTSENMTPGFTLLGEIRMVILTKLNLKGYQLGRNISTSEAILDKR